MTSTKGEGVMIGLTFEERRHLVPQIQQLLPKGGRVLEYGGERFRAVVESLGSTYECVDSIAADDEAPRGFDCVLAVYALERIVDQDEYRRVLRKIYSALVPLGRLVVVDLQPTDLGDPSLLPRGPLSAIDAWPAGALHVLATEYQGHWIGWLGRDEKRVRRDVPALTTLPE